MKIYIEKWLNISKLVQNYICLNSSMYKIQISYEQLTDPRAFWFVENTGGLKFDKIDVCENIYPSIITNLSPTKSSLFGK